MYDREAFDGIFNAITTWEVVAQQTPLPDLTALATNYQTGLAECLNALHDLYDAHAGQVPADTFALAIGEVTKRATVTAIFALGLSQRVRLAAQQN